MVVSSMLSTGWPTMVSAWLTSARSSTRNLDIVPPSILGVVASASSSVAACICAETGITVTSVVLVAGSRFSVVSVISWFLPAC